MSFQMGFLRLVCKILIKAGCVFLNIKVHVQRKMFFSSSKLVMASTVTYTFLYWHLKLIKIMFIDQANTINHVSHFPLKLFCVV